MGVVKTHEQGCSCVKPYGEVDSQKSRTRPNMFSAMTIPTITITAIPVIPIPAISLLANVIAAGTGLCMVFHFLPQILARLDRVEKLLEVQDEESVGSEASSLTVLDRIVEERDGKLTITTVFGYTDKIGELVESLESPLEPVVTEETAEFAGLLEGASEFADLLNEEKKPN